MCRLPITHVRKICRKCFDGLKANQVLDYLCMLLHYFFLHVGVSRREFAHRSRSVIIACAQRTKQIAGLRLPRRKFRLCYSVFAYSVNR